MSEEWYKALDRIWTAKWAAMDSELNENFDKVNNFNASRYSDGGADPSATSFDARVSRDSGSGGGFDGSARGSGGSFDSRRFVVDDPSNMRIRVRWTLWQILRAFIILVVFVVLNCVLILVSVYKITDYVMMTLIGIVMKIVRRLKVLGRRWVGKGEVGSGGVGVREGGKVDSATTTISTGVAGGSGAISAEDPRNLNHDAESGDAVGRRDAEGAAMGTMGEEEEEEEEVGESGYTFEGGRPAMEQRLTSRFGSAFRQSQTEYSRDTNSTLVSLLDDACWEEYFRRKQENEKSEDSATAKPSGEISPFTPAFGNNEEEERKVDEKEKREEEEKGDEKNATSSTSCHSQSPTNASPGVLPGASPGASSSAIDPVVQVDSTVSRQNDAALLATDATFVAALRHSQKLAPRHLLGAVAISRRASTARNSSSGNLMSSGLSLTSPASKGSRGSAFNSALCVTDVDSTMAAELAASFSGAATRRPKMAAMETDATAMEEADTVWEDAKSELSPTEGAVAAPTSPPEFNADDGSADAAAAAAAAATATAAATRPKEIRQPRWPNSAMAKFLEKPERCLRSRINFLVDDEDEIGEDIGRKHKFMM